jgi:alkylation response protein AidB-like acyl-CoA dehydrogenase
MILSLLSQVRERMLTPENLRRWDDEEIFPEAEIRELLGPDIGLQLLFIPEEYGGMGGGARDMAAFSEEMAKICLGVATAFLAIRAATSPASPPPPLLCSTPTARSSAIASTATNSSYPTEAWPTS